MRLAASASALYAKNLLNLLNLFLDKDTGTAKIDWDDDIIKGVALTKDGKIIHPLFASAKKSVPKAKPKPKAAAAAKKPAAKKSAAKSTTAKKAATKKTASKTTKTKNAAKKPVTSTAKKTTPKKKTAAKK